MPNFHIYSAFWGDHYVNLFRDACLRSLMWPKNLEVIKGCRWNIFTKKAHFGQIEEIFKDKPFSVNVFEIGEGLDIAGCGKVPTIQCDSGVILLKGIQQEVLYSLKQKSRMILAPPDTIFGDGTVGNLLKLGSVPTSCVAVAHARVLPSILEDIAVLGATRGSISNAHLVTLAFKHAHDSWKFCEVGHEDNRSIIGGISWKELEKGLYSVVHRLPTHYLVDFIDSDWSFWWSQVSFGSWDHKFPAENMIRQERQRYAGSSDACFIVEVTEWDKNVPFQIDKSKLIGIPHEDAFFAGQFHNTINRQTSVIFRGE